MTRLPLPVLALVLALCSLTTSNARAATITADGTTCTLADAIVAANTDAATGGCPQGDAGADTVVLDADVTLTAADLGSTVRNGVGAGLPDVTDDLTITAGLGSVIRRDPKFTCDAATVDPVFRFLNLESGSLTLQSLSFEDGCFVAADTLSQGGGIYAAASTRLTLDEVSVARFGAFTTSGSFDGAFLYSLGDELNVVGSHFDDIEAESAGDLSGGVIHAEELGPVTLIQV
ncbi:MAG: hypothetical protein AAFX50_14700 [Acidobacteriota bacterium]